MELLSVILVVLSLGGCWSRGPVIIFYDGGLSKLPPNQRMLTEIVVRDLQLELTFSSLIVARIPVRPRANYTNATDFMLLTSKATIRDKLRHLPVVSDQESLVWSLSVEPSCSKSFRLTKPVQPAAVEELSNLILETRSTKKSVLPMSTVTCSKSYWNSQEVIVGTTEASPFVVRSEVGGVLEWRGKDIDLFKDLSERIGFKYTIVEPSIFDRSSGYVRNNTGTGLIGMAFRNEFDVTVYANLYGNELFLSLVWPTYYGRWAVVIPPPTIAYDYLSNTKPFSFTVWLCVIASILGVALSMWFMGKSLGFATDLGLDVLYNVSLVTGQGGFSPKYLPGRFVAGTWNLGAFIVVFSYTSILISFVTAPMPEPLIKTFQDFLTKGTVKPVACKELDAATGMAKEIGDLFRSNPESLVKTDKEGVAMVLGGRYALITGVPMAKSAIYEDFRNTGKCRMTIAQEKGIELNLVGWYTSNLTPSLNQLLHKWILYATEAGLLIFYEKLYVPQVACFDMKNLVGSSNENHPLILVQLQTAFLILGLGTVASLLAFIGEKCKSMFPNKRS